MNSQQVQAALSQVQNAYDSAALTATLDVGKVITFLQDGINQLSTDLQTAFDCLPIFICVGFKATALAGVQIELAQSLGLESHTALLRDLVIQYEIAKRDEEAGLG